MCAQLFSIDGNDVDSMKLKIAVPFRSGAILQRPHSHSVWQGVRGSDDDGNAVDSMKVN